MNRFAQTEDLDGSIYRSAHIAPVRWTPVLALIPENRLHRKGGESDVYPVDISFLWLYSVVTLNKIISRRHPVGSVQTKLFKSNRSQAVRLPKEVAFSEEVQTVEITAIGNRRIIAPAGQSWDEWFDAPGVSADFMASRMQPADQRRDHL